MPTDSGFGELVRRVRIGNQDAHRDVRSIVTKGIAFLLRRRLGKEDVSAEFASVTEATVRAMQTSGSCELRDLSKLIVSVIHDQFPSSVTAAAARPDPSTLKAAQSVLAELSPLERSILGQHYTLGATPAAIQSRLAVDSQTIKDTLTRARFLFFRKAARD